MKQTETNESHQHKWVRTTLANDTDGVMISHACECGMWKIEPTKNIIDIKFKKYGKPKKHW